MQPGFIDVDADTVVLAGHRTANTAQDWGSWATRCSTAFSNAGQAMRDSRIELAENLFALDVVLGARQVGQRVETLGLNTVEAGTVMATTDVESATILDQHPTHESTTLLRRPINADHAPLP